MIDILYQNHSTMHKMASIYIVSSNCNPSTTSFSTFCQIINSINETTAIHSFFACGSICVIKSCFFLPRINSGCFPNRRKAFLLCLVFCLARTRQTEICPHLKLFCAIKNPICGFMPWLLWETVVVHSAKAKSAIGILKHIKYEEKATSTLFVDMVQCLTIQGSIVYLVNCSTRMLLNY